MEQISKIIFPVTPIDDDKIRELTVYSKKEELKDLAQQIHGSKGGGIKMFDKHVVALSGTDETMILEKTFADQRKAIISKRQAGRLFLVCRSAATTLTRARPSEVATIKNEAKVLNVTIPHELMARLEKLEKEGGQAGAVRA